MKLENFVIFLVLIFTILFSLCSCETNNVKVKNSNYKVHGSELELYVIDSCEYIGLIYMGPSDKLTHKGNCRFCKERNKRNNVEFSK